MKPLVPGLDPLRAPNRLAVITALSVLAALGVALLWAAWVEIDISATGTGRIVPSKQIQVIQNLEGGIVQAILVKEGERVAEQQPLARIQDTEFSATLTESLANEAQLMADAARLTAEAQGRPISFPPGFERAHPALAAQARALYALRQKELRAQQAALREDEGRARNTAAKARGSLPLLRATLKLALEQRDILARQVQAGMVSNVELLGIDQKVLDLRTRIQDAERDVDGATIGQQQSQYKFTAEAERFRAEAAGQLSEVQGKLAALKPLVGANRDRVVRREVRAPARGVVKRILVTTPGAVVRPGDVMMELVPSDDELLVEARFAPQDIGFIYAGQPAWVRITAYDASIYGALPAEVIQVAADAVVNEREEMYYTVRIRAKRGFEGAAAGRELMPGMVAQVDVVTGKRTVLDYILKPITRLRFTALRER